MPIYRKNTMSAGLLIDRPDTPQPGDEYLSTDTKQYFICYELGAWEIATPIYAEALEAVYLAVTAGVPKIPIKEDLCYLQVGAQSNGVGYIISTAPTKGQLTEDNVLAASHRNPSLNSTFVILKEFTDGLIKKGADVYVYQFGKPYATLAELLTDKDTQYVFIPTGTVSNGLNAKKPFYLKSPSVVIE